MQKLFISTDICHSLYSMLEGMGFSVITLPKEKSLPAPVSSHADMLIFSDRTNHITARAYFEKHSALFDGVDMTLTDDSFGSVYPEDVIFNAFTLRGCLFGRLNSLSKKLLQLYPNAVDLRQGYAKCSTLLFGNNAVTQDPAIAAALRKFGCNLLEISSGHILLPGYDYGFIGGASFVYENKVIFFGDITKHPDYEAIKKFISLGGYELVFDRSSALTDLGGAFCPPPQN